MCTHRAGREKRKSIRTTVFYCVEFLDNPKKQWILGVFTVVYTSTCHVCAYPHISAVANLILTILIFKKRKEKILHFFF